MRNISIIIILVLVYTTSCKKRDQETPGDNEIFLEYKTFRPTQRSITKGTTITFINKDNANHTATSMNKTFDSGTIKSGQSYSYTFADSGLFYFYCSFHSNSSAEQGVILVK